MLSLKKAAATTTEQLSLPTMTDTNSRGLSAGGNQSLHFAFHTLDMSRGVPEVLTSNEEGVELDSMSQHHKIDPEMMKGSCSRVEMDHEF